MAQVSRKEFGEMCGKTQAYIGMMVRRGKVVENDKRKINTELPINYAYFIKTQTPDKVLQYEKEQAKIATIKKNVQAKAKIVVAKEEKENTRKKEIQELKESLIQPLKPQVNVSTTTTATQPGIFGIDAEIKQAQLKKIKIDIAEKEIKVAKLNGEVIPFDLVQLLFNQHSKSITTAFHNATDNIITDFQKEFGLTREDSAKLRGNLIEVVNQAVKESISISKKQVKNIVSEYSIKKGRGEKN